MVVTLQVVVLFAVAVVFGGDAVFVDTACCSE